MFRWEYNFTGAVPLHWGQIVVPQEIDSGDWWVSVFQVPWSHSIEGWRVRWRNRQKYKQVSKNEIWVVEKYLYKVKLR